MKLWKSILPKAILTVIIFTLLCGVIYPFLITGISQLFMKNKADGSMIEIDGKTYGSELIGQQFTGDEYLWGRIMNTDTDTFQGENGEKAVYGWASNLTPASEDYADLIQERVDKIKAANPDAKTDKIPVDLVTCSGSGLDPEISVDAADYQIQRIAKERDLSEDDVQKVIDEYTKGRFLGIFGEKTVNVLKVNLALDGVLK